VIVKFKIAVKGHPWSNVGCPDTKTILTLRIAAYRFESKAFVAKAKVKGEHFGLEVRVLTLLNVCREP